MMNRINTFSNYCRKTFGSLVYKIPLDLGIRCPNRKTGGCIFCNGDAFAPGYLSEKDSVVNQLKRGKRQILQSQDSLYFGYFQQETSTASPFPLLTEHVETIFKDPCSVGVILSTRPDSISDELLKPLSLLCYKYHKQCCIELGLQSAHDSSLARLNRNHSFKDFEDSARSIRNYPDLEFGVHLLFGIPGETTQDMVESVDRVCQYGIGHLKFHHLQVLRNTQLQKIFESGSYTPLTMESYFELLLNLLPVVPSQVIIHRLWASAHPHLLIAPKWNILPTRLSQKLLERMEKLDVWQGQLSERLEQ